MQENIKNGRCTPNCARFNAVRHAHYVLEGDPTALKRPRITRKTMFDPQKQQKLITGINLERQHPYKELFQGPLLLIAEFFFKMPVKISHKKQDALCGKPVLKKPDLSNLIKYIEDAATKVLYHDDCIITTIESIKRYSSDPHTHFIIAEDFIGS